MSDVIVVLGSPSDLAWAQRIVDGLDQFNVTSEIRIGSAHKTPAYLLHSLEEIERSGDDHVFITVAGRSNALSGFVDAAVTAPVIACPPASDAFSGMDVLSSLRMPSGVAPLVVLDPQNAAFAAVKILALARPALRASIQRAHQEDRDRVTAADQETMRPRAPQGIPR